jgi:hypothetical protein
MFFWGANFHVVVTKKEVRQESYKGRLEMFWPKCSIFREKDYQKLRHLSSTFMEVATTKQDFEKKNL